MGERQFEVAYTDFNTCFFSFILSKQNNKFSKFDNYFFFRGTKFCRVQIPHPQSNVTFLSPLIC